MYSHQTGEFEPPVYVRPSKLLLVEGLLGLHTETLAVAARHPRGAGASGGAAEGVEGEARLHPARIHDGRGARGARCRQGDAEEFVQPQRRYADIVVAFAQTARTTWLTWTPT